MESESSVYRNVSPIIEEAEEVEEVGDVGVEGEGEGEEETPCLEIFKFIPQAPEEVKPKIGKEFGSESEAYDFYNAYARCCGFSIRRWKARKLKSGEISMRYFSCSKQGVRDQKHLERNDRKRRPQALTRCDCPAKMKVNKSKGVDKWVVTLFQEEHSHKLMTPNKSHCLRSHRNVPNPHLDVVEDLNVVGVGVARALEFFSNEVGGRDFIGYEERDIRNALRRRRYDKYGKSAQLLLEYFHEKSEEDPNFTYKVQLDENCRMTSCFWVDNVSKMDYEAFGDVVSFDTTYKTNEYDMPFGPFVGLNHHKQSILLGAGLLFGETTEDFKWLFETWLQAMGGRAPNAIITDQDPAIRAAIAEVFPNTKHRLCLWHIAQKLPERLGNVFHEYPDFNSDRSNCVYQSEEEEEFEEAWFKMIACYRLSENTWLQNLFNIRSMWVPAYTNSTFMAGQTTTGRSESVNAMFDSFVNHKTTLLEFAAGYERALDKRRHAELRADCETSNGMPVLSTKWPIEAQMARVYTREIFYEFQKEWAGVVDYTAQFMERDGVLVKYIVCHGLTDKKRIVVWDEEKNFAYCPCKNFQFHGVVCAHILTMFKLAKIKLMPESHILKRWTQKAKERSNNCLSEANTNIENSSLMRRHVLFRSWTYIVNQSMTHVEAFNVAAVRMVDIADAIREMKLDEKTGDVPVLPYDASVGQNEIDGIQNVEEEGEYDNLNTQSSTANVLLDPHVVPHKGRTNKRLKPGRETTPHEGRLCRGCNKVVIGHDRRNCPEVYVSNVAMSEVEGEAHRNHGRGVIRGRGRARGVIRGGESSNL